MAVDPTDYGYFKVSRKLYATDPFWNEKRIFSRHEAWEDLMQSASYLPHTRVVNGEIVQLGYGEVLASLRFLADRWCWGAKKVRIFLALLVRMERITAQRETQHGTVYLLVNYHLYNGPGQDEDTPEGTARAHPGHSEGTKRSKGNKGKNGNTNSPGRSPAAPDPLVEGFDRFWGAYPPRAGSRRKKDAQRSWRARRAEGVEAKTMIDAATRYAAFCQATGKVRTEKVAQAPTFLNDVDNFANPWTIPTQQSSRNGRKPEEAPPLEQRQREQEDRDIHDWALGHPQEAEKLETRANVEAANRHLPLSFARQLYRRWALEAARHPGLALVPA